ncbi:SH3 domain-containing protein, partial [Cellulophaga sp. Z1A5H]|uniref:SH3 domain-containing protein n=1 Tax=Cellulophaga sp. Z1A5H TaxID=2687291 RepID=UPI00196B8D55
YSKLIKSKIINEGDFFSGYVEKLCYIDKDFNIWVSYFVFRDEGNSLSICYVTNEKYKLDFNDGLFVKNNRNTFIVGTEVYAQVDTYLNIRSTPDSKGAIVGKAYPKDGLKVLEILEAWVKIELNGKQGYVSKDFVR